MDFNKKLKYFQNIQKDVQEKWTQQNDVSVDLTKPKYFVTFPYPYMNGRLHLGHAFTITKAEFTARFKKLQGYNVLFPFAFHCTGMPIQAAANKLKLELTNPDYQVKEITSTITKYKISSKVASKSEGISQKEIMIKNGIPEEEVEKFTDPKHWLTYFPPLGKQDLQLFGLNVDWRRSFITTNANPHYDSFVRWQFNKLKKADKIDFGKRPTIYSLTDGQVCADHDRSSGEGVQPKEVILNKIKISDNTYFINYLESEVNTNNTYGIYKMKNNETFICTERIMKNMMMQNMTESYGRYNCVGSIKGLDIRISTDIQTIAYWEPETTVVSRSGDECVVAQIDQWYIKYGEEEWKQAVECFIKSPNFKTNCPEDFEKALNWLHEWACTRSFGLGTNLPWDDQFVIESLSDSTIYMAFYTVAHLVDFEMTEQDWDYVFLSDSLESPKNYDSPNISTLNLMKAEFNYWYPLDLRVSGKDLIQNHLIMSLYNHSAIWNNQVNRMPQSFYCNGHIMVDNEKMSKSKGNFIVLKEAIETWGADAVRFGLAMSGDILDDANFKRVYAEEAIGHLFEEDEFIKENTMYENLRESDYIFADQVFNEKISQCIMETEKAYNNLRFRDVIIFGFFEMRTARNYYRDMCRKQKVLMHKNLVERYIDSLLIMLYPICPHYCEYISKKELKWPSQESINQIILEMDSYMSRKIHDFRKIVTKNKYKAAIITVSTEWPEWQKTCLDKLRSFTTYPSDIKNIMLDFIKSDPILKPKITKLMSVITFAIENNSDMKIKFDEAQLWKDNLDYVCKTLELDYILITSVHSNDNISPLNPIISGAVVNL